MSLLRLVGANQSLCFTAGEVAYTSFLAFLASFPGYACEVTDIYGAGICSEEGRPHLHHLCLFAV